MENLGVVLFFSRKMIEMASVSKHHLLCKEMANTILQMSVVSFKTIL